MRIFGLGKPKECTSWSEIKQLAQSNFIDRVLRDVIAEAPVPLDYIETDFSKPGSVTIGGSWHVGGQDFIFEVPCRDNDVGEILDEIREAMEAEVYSAHMERLRMAARVMEADEDELFRLKMFLGGSE